MKRKTIGNIFRPIIAAKTQEEADVLFKNLVEFYIQRNCGEQDACENLAKTNIAWFVRHMNDMDLVERVTKLYDLEIR